MATVAGRFANRDDPAHRRALRILTVLLALAIAVSVVHYLDNYLNYEDFPTSPDVPAPSKTLVGLSWFGFTAAGVLGYLLFRRASQLGLACLLLGLYSLSGLVGFGHYTAAGMLAAPWWRQAHVIADIACGVAVAAFALLAWQRYRGGMRPEGAGSTASPPAGSGG